MLNDNLNIIRADYSRFNDFLALFKTDLHNNWVNQFNNEDIEGYSCYWTEISQYILIYNYIALLSNAVKYDTNDWSSLKTTYNIDDYTKYLSCIGVDINDIYDLFNLKVSDDGLYIWENNDYLEFKMVVNSIDTFVITTVLTGNTYIEWDGIREDLSNGINNKSLTVGIYIVKIYGDLDLITDLTMEGRTNSSIESISMTTKLSNLGNLDLHDNILNKKSIDEILIIMNKIANDGLIKTKTLKLNGGSNSDSLEYIPCASLKAQCNLTNYLNWTISTNNTDSINCS